MGALDGTGDGGRGVMAEHDAYAVERARLLLAFGENLRALRKRRNLAQEGFAEVANVHRNEIGVLERGQCEPGLLTLLILADAVEVPLKALTERVPAPRERRPARILQRRGTREGGRGVRVEDDADTVEHVRLLLAFGEKLRAERDRLNVSQETLAEIANVHRTHLVALELGKRDPRLTMLLILAAALEVAPGTLLEGLAVPTERKAPTHFKRGRLAPEAVQR
jgi:transcriptional regulator with XRE-family HTH domain